MKAHLRLIGATAISLATLAAVPTRADTIEALYLYPNLGTVFENDGTQSTSPGFSFSMDSGDITLAESHGNTDTLTINAFNVFGPAAFNGPEIIDLTGPLIFTNVSLASSTIAGFISSDVTFDSSHYWLNLEGLTASAGQTVVLNFSASTSTRVPEPVTLALFGAGLLGLGFIYRRRTVKRALS